MRFFGLVLVVVAMAQSANAALLSTWNFDSNANASVESGVTGSGTAFVNVGTSGSNGINGSISAQRWDTATNVTNSSAVAGDSKYNMFSFTNTSSIGYVLSEMKLDLARIGGTGTNLIKVVVTQQIGAGAEDELFTFSSNSGTSVNKSDSLGDIILAAGETATYKFYYSRSVGTLGASIDNIQLLGSAVPEPTSMAIFGLLGVGAAARRFRRKK